MVFYERTFLSLMSAGTQMGIKLRTSLSFTLSPNLIVTFMAEVDFWLILCPDPSFVRGSFGMTELNGSDLIDPQFAVGGVVEALGDGQHEHFSL